jgi:hypothetical protein
MTFTPLGSLSLAAVVPGAATVAAAGELGINLALPDIQARLAALLAFTPTMPSLSADASLAANIVADLQAAISIGLVPPDITAQLAIIAALVLDLQNKVISINAQFSICADLISLLATAGVDAYACDGAAQDMGGALTTQYAGDASHANALILVTKIGATWSAMSTLFKVTP